jgi:altronate dehydratase
MSSRYAFQDIARMAAPADNTAVATARLEVGQEVIVQGRPWRLRSTFLVGHRFAVRPISAGESLLSWGLPFGQASRDIATMEYVCNASALKALRTREIAATLPREPNFLDFRPRFALDESNFTPAPPLPLYPRARDFQGFLRGPGRGAGTRNYIVLLGTTSESAGFVRQLEQRVGDLGRDLPQLDGIVAVTHTEGSVQGANNGELLLRTLAGFMIHPNIGAVLAVDQGWEPISNRALQDYLSSHGYPLGEVLHQFLSLQGGFEEGMQVAEAVVRRWLEPVTRVRRQDIHLRGLALALQCGGSDTFSGISGNPLVAELSREAIQHGAAAVLAETTELMGAESYVLQKVRDIETARRFLEKVEAYRALADWHGETVEENVSAGNKIRGLYNITLKSMGAARKRHPAVRLEEVIDYGARLASAGLTFMDSPGADLESVAGQVAAGCNLILFTTGSGSVTNFPFVPTLKVVTTSARFRLLQDDMDINAGRYLDGEPMDALACECFDFVVAVASGQKTKGERQGHAQTLIWRNWQQAGPGSLAKGGPTATPRGIPVVLSLNGEADARRFVAMRNRNGWARERVGLILPASLCSAQVAVLAARRLNAAPPRRDTGVSHFIALPHSEGCTTLGPAEKLATRTLLGYLRHPLVERAFLLEHGCEKTHNTYLRRRMLDEGMDPGGFGWGSVQLDGGVQSVLAKIQAWAQGGPGSADAPHSRPVGLDTASIGLTAMGQIPEASALALGHFVQNLLASGATCLLPMNAILLSADPFRGSLRPRGELDPTLVYGGRPSAAGLHLMQSPSLDLAETLSGLGAAGIGVIFVYADGRGISGHPLIPVVHLSAGPPRPPTDPPDLRLRPEDSPAKSAARLMDLLLQVLSGKYIPHATRRGDAQFQLARGAQGISL